MNALYLLLLVAALACMALVDRRWRLAFWCDARRAAIVLAAGVVTLLVADIIGIAVGVFSRASTWATTGVLVGPELPLEEPVFLAFLTYLAMNLLALGARIHTRSEKSR